MKRMVWLAIILVSWNAFAASCDKELAEVSSVVTEIARLMVRRAHTEQPAIRSVLSQNIADIHRRFQAAMGRPIRPDEIRDAAAKLEAAERMAAENGQRSGRSQRNLLNWELQTQWIKESLLPTGYSVTSGANVVQTENGRVKIIASVARTPSGEAGNYILDLVHPEKGFFIPGVPTFYSSPRENTVIAARADSLQIYDGDTGDLKADLDIKLFPGNPKPHHVEAFPYEDGDGKMRVIVKAHVVGSLVDCFDLDPSTGDARTIFRGSLDFKVYVGGNRRSVYAYDTYFVNDLLSDRTILDPGINPRQNTVRKPSPVLYESRNGRLFLALSFESQSFYIWDVHALRRMRFQRGKGNPSTQGGFFRENAVGGVAYFTNEVGNRQVVVNLEAEKAYSMVLPGSRFSISKIFEPSENALIYLATEGDRSILAKAKVGNDVEVKEVSLHPRDFVNGYVTNDGAFALVRTATDNLSLVKLYGPPPEVEP